MDRISTVIVTVYSEMMCSLSNIITKHKIKKNKGKKKKNRTKTADSGISNSTAQSQRHYICIVPFKSMYTPRIIPRCVRLEAQSFTHFWGFCVICQNKAHKRFQGSEKDRCVKDFFIFQIKICIHEP